MNTLGAREADPDWEQRSDEDKAALYAGALSWPDRKMQRWGLPCHWRESGPFDWTGCDEVEVVPGKLSGVPVLRGTRFSADNLLQQVEWGEVPEEIAEDYGLNLIQVRAVLSFARQTKPDTVAA